MTDLRFENNRANITGKVVSSFPFSHEVSGERFYTLQVEIPRLRNSYDILPVMVSERLIDVTADYEEKYMEVTGQYRSFDDHREKTKGHLLLFVYAYHIKVSEDMPKVKKSNEIYLDGFICRPPIYRKTPLGREICDVLMGVNRSHGRSDYIPCICWGRDARFAGSLTVSTNIRIWGRIQSREYQKLISEAVTEKRIAYEVSINKFS